MDKRREILGIALVIFIGVCFAMANTLAGVAYQGGTDALTVSTARFFLPAIVIAVILAASRKRLLLPGRDGVIAAVLGVVTAAYTWALLTSIHLLPVSLAVLVFYLFPIFTAFIVAAMGWEKLQRMTMVAAVIAFGGLAFALGVGGKGLDPVGILLAALAATGLATVSAVSHRVIRSGDPRQTTLYISVTAAVTFVALTAFAGDFVLPTTREGWLGFLGTNLFYCVAMIGFFAAISLIGPAKTTLFSYVEPIMATAAAYVLLGQVLTPEQFAGALVVVVALVTAAASGLRASRAPGAEAHGTRDS